MKALQQQLRKLQLRSALLSVIILMVAFAAGLALFLRMASVTERELVQQQEYHLNNAIAMINRDFGDARRILDLLYHDTRIRQGLSEEQSINRPRLIRGMRDVAAALSNLLQVRWLDASGHEIVRINKTVDGVLSVTPEEQMQNKADRYYFTDAMQQPLGSYYYSRADLNVEHGAVVIPFEPTVRVGFRTGSGDGLQDGLLLINYDLRSLLARVRTIASGDIRLRLGNDRGYWLLHENPAVEWGEDLGLLQYSLKSQDPDLWRKVAGVKLALGLHSGGEIVSVQALRLTAEDDHNALFLIAVSPQSVMAAARFRAMLIGLSVSAVLLLLGWALVFYDWRVGHTQLVLANQLNQEKNELERVNSELQRSLHEQQLLQNELVETRKLSSLGMMVAGVAHELNTPIGGAVMMASDLQDGVRELKDALTGGLTREAFERYLAHSEQALSLLNANLARARTTVSGFKRLAMDRVNDELADFELRDVVDDLLYSFVPLLKQERVQVQNAVSAGVKLHGYAGVMSQTLQNLVVNAVQHAFAGLTDRQVVVRAEYSGEKVQIEVEDNGHGINPALADTLFDPFVTTRRGEGSTGLGMYLVHQWVTRQMGGSITVIRAPQGGLIIRLIIPRVMKGSPVSDPADLY